MKRVSNRVRLLAERVIRFRIVRFLMTSGASALVGVVFLLVPYIWLHMAPWACSLISFGAAGVTSYVLSRRWAFSRTGRSRLGREIFPFLVLSVATLVVAAAAAQLGSDVAQSITSSRSVQSLVVLGSVISASILAIPLRYAACLWIFTSQRVPQSAEVQPVAGDLIDA